MSSTLSQMYVQMHRLRVANRRDHCTEATKAETSVSNSNARGRMFTHKSRVSSWLAGCSPAGLYNPAFSRLTLNTSSAFSWVSFRCPGWPWSEIICSEVPSDGISDPELIMFAPQLRSSKTNTSYFSWRIVLRLTKRKKMTVCRRKGGGVARVLG